MTQYSLANKKIYVAGHNGMVGSAIVRALSLRGHDPLVASRTELDLTNQTRVREFFAHHRPDVVFLAAAKVGGIEANRTSPVDFLEQNLAIQLNVIRSAHEHGVERLIFLGSSCIYPKHASQPIQERELLTGPLEPTNEWYAIAKITGIKLCQAYRLQHGDSFISAMPCNLYGYGDNFDLKTSHVLPALLRKAHEAVERSERELIVWGTGEPRREFLFSDDAADALVFLSEHYDGESHINVGYGSDVRIRELVELVCEAVGFKGEIIYDTSMPDGTPRKLMSSDKLFSLGWRPTTDLRTGIGKLYEWYLQREQTRSVST